MPFFIGVDGGGTKTEIVCCDRSGQTLLTLTGSSTNPRSLGFSQAVSNLTGLLSELLSHKELASMECRGVCIGLAGAAMPEEQVPFRDAVEELFSSSPFPVPLTITNDAEIALMATLSRRNGLIAISGTGSIVYGITLAGERYRVGGWGHLLGDEGSGYAIGLQALKTVMNSYDGLDPPTAITPLLLDAFQWESITELRAYIYQDHIRKSDIASFAQYCLRAAEQDDPAALAILQQQARALARQSAALIAKDKQFAQEQLVAAGSIFKHSSLFFHLFQEELHAAWPLVTIHLAQRTPAYGAAKLAIALHGE
ncbi:BadF/BadG/BcrA/BcrD ATPase family protein [Paenibacillus senegalensis]|uniref:BadF/BadG/BcrA/BcrD ATPase family protein n=1 Tax=Paenibacillus senegalensis TaxID=1465766 RepID=UPI000287B155|nr:BadF/BadG/BcrA/BcrD ATPase family protein [Paenibacillus senegalensis]